MWLFLYPTKDAVTFRLHGWCMLGVGFFASNSTVSRAWMSGSFEYMQWNACVHTLDLILYSPKEFLGNRVRTDVKSKGKNSLYGNNFPPRRIKPTTLHQAGQQAQHTTNELFQPQNHKSNFPQNHTCGSQQLSLKAVALCSSANALADWLKQINWEKMTLTTLSLHRFSHSNWLLVCANIARLIMFGSRKSRISSENCFCWALAQMEIEEK